MPLGLGARLTDADSGGAEWRYTEMISPSLSGTGSSYHILSISSFYIKSINIKAITPSVKQNIMRLIKPQAISPGVPGRLALA